MESWVPSPQLRGKATATNVDMNQQPQQQLEQKGQVVLKQLSHIISMWYKRVKSAAPRAVVHPVRNKPHI